MTSKTTTRQRAATRRCKPAQLATCVNAVLVALTLGMHLLTAAPVRADEITLVESGSTLIYPLFNVWATEYMKTHPGVRIVTNSTGSDHGIKQAISGAAHIGTSDAYMSDAEIRQNPQIINVARSRRRPSTTICPVLTRRRSNSTARCLPAFTRAGSAPGTTRPSLR
jgi:hypothetical protein